ncbi:MAG: hypothetical protein RL226_2265 [Bacteroidota bacterium]|jgi:signal transduction histidine kinase
MFDISGPIGYILYGGLFLFSILSISLILFVYAYRKKQLVHEAELKLKQQEYDMQALRSRMEISEQTLKQLSREIHDNLGQRLSLVYQSMEQGDPEMRQLLMDVIQSMRNLSRSLHEDYIAEQGIDLALDRECKLFTKATKIDCTYLPPEQNPKLTSKEEIILFRCAQELLNNAGKYSGADHVTVSLQATNENTHLTVSDNGKGFAVESVTEGIGLRSLKERVALLKGKIMLTSTPETGTQTEIILFHPLTNEYES